jgi:hypothetical protein
MRQDVVEGQKTCADVSNLVVAPIAKLAFADGLVQGARVQMVDATPATISLGGRVALREELLDEVRVPLAALGVGEVQELPHSEVPGMRCHKVEKMGFDFGVTERSERSELGC